VASAGRGVLLLARASDSDKEWTVNEQRITRQAPNAALTEDDLARVVGGGSDPVDPTPIDSSPVDEGLKATPIPF
jgi:hypothetical protein